MRAVQAADIFARQIILFEFVTRSVGTDSGTICRVLRMLVNIQPGLLPQTLQRFDVAPSTPTPICDRFPNRNALFYCVLSSIS